MVRIELKRFTRNKIVKKKHFPNLAMENLENVYNIKIVFMVY